MNSSFSLYASTKQLSRKVIYSGNGRSTVPASFSRAMLLLGSFYPQHICSRINLPIELILSCRMHLFHWHIASLQYVWFLDARLNDAQLSATSFNLWQKVSGSLLWSTPSFFIYIQDQKHPFGDQPCWGMTEAWADLVWQWHVLCLVCLLYHGVVDILCH